MNKLYNKFLIICMYFKSLYFFGQPFRSHFAKAAHKVAKSKLFKYLNRILISNKFPFKLCIICLCHFNCFNINGGGGGGGGGGGSAPPLSCILQKCEFILFGVKPKLFIIARQVGLLIFCGPNYCFW